MRQYFPLSAFEHESQAVIAADEDGTIRVCNHAACQLLGVALEEVLGRTCWTLQAFRQPDGSAFCGARCPVRHAAREGQPGARHVVVAASGPNAGQQLELISFLVPSRQRDRCGVVHFLRPLSSATAPAGLVGFDLQGAGLTPRECEVLQLIAEGRSTQAMAGALGIRPTTVRNHIRNILRKLGLHRRIEAVVALGRASQRDDDPTSRPEPAGIVDPRRPLK